MVAEKWSVFTFGASQAGAYRNTGLRRLNADAGLRRNDDGNHLPTLLRNTHVSATVSVIMPPRSWRFGLSVAGIRCASAARPNMRPPEPGADRRGDRVPPSITWPHGS
ncbi:hypothetical protein FAIPA1_140032 [Frankia sp. AiPs1]